MAGSVQRHHAARHRRARGRAGALLARARAAPGGRAGAPDPALGGVHRRLGALRRGVVCRGGLPRRRPPVRDRGVAGSPGPGDPAGLRDRGAYRRHERRGRRPPVRGRHPPGWARCPVGGPPGYLRPDLRALHLGQAGDHGPAGKGPQAVGQRLHAAALPHRADGTRFPADRPDRHRPRARLTAGVSDRWLRGVAAGWRVRNYLTMSKTSLPSSDTAGTGTARDGRVRAVREFNRVYTNVIGLLHGNSLDSPYSLTEARVLFELAHPGETGRGESEVSVLRRTVDIDAGYLSRILARFEADGLITRRRSDSDARRRVIRLTAAGEQAFQGLDQRSAEQIGGLLDQLTDAEQQRLTTAMAPTA